MPLSSGYSMFAICSFIAMEIDFCGFCLIRGIWECGGLARVVGVVEKVRDGWREELVCSFL